MNALRSYRDDGLLVELAGRALPPRSAALPWTCPVLLVPLVLLVAPARSAPIALCVAAVAAAVLSGPAFRSPHAGRLDWLVPPLLRAAEYGALLRLATIEGASAVPACYLLLAALAYHHYDLVYRLRDRGEEPSVWLRRIGLGWDGRLLAAGLLAAVGLLQPALYVAGAVLLVGYVTEGTAAWLREEREPA